MKKLILILVSFSLLFAGCGNDIDYRDVNMYIDIIDEYKEDITPENSNILIEAVEVLDLQTYLTTSVNQNRTNLQAFLNTLTIDQAESFYYEFIETMDYIQISFKNNSNQIIENVDHFTKKPNEFNETILTEIKQEFYNKFLLPLFE